MGGRRSSLRISVLAAATGMILWCAVPARAATTFTVTTTNDADDGACTVSVCTLRDAIKYSSAGDTVVVPAAMGPYTLSIGELKIDHNLTINGAGASSVTISGNDAHRVFELGPGTIVTMSGVTVAHGNGTGGTIADGRGGAIGFSSATLTLIASVVSDSTAITEGGGVYDAGTMTIRDSTIAGNTVTGGAFVSGGGGIAVEDMLTMTGSTVTGNSSTSHGGGIYGDDVTVINNSTITGNTASVDGGGFWSTAPTLTNVTIASNTAPDGANVFFETSSGSFQNTIVSHASGGGANCDKLSSVPASGGHNLEDDSAKTCGFVGSGDLSGVDPLLGPLQNNGGLTQTEALQAGSPAIDAGTAGAGCPATDQRGMSRPDNGESVCDMGAYELQDSTSSPPPPQQFTLNVSLAGTGSGTVSGSGISCPGICTHSYPAGTGVLLTVTPAAASSFTGWGGACTGTGSCKLAINSNQTVTATFSAAPQAGMPTVTAAAPICTVKPVSNRLAIRKAKRSNHAHPRTTPGYIKLIAQCDQNVKATLNGTLTELVGKKPKHGKQRTKTFRLATLQASLNARIPIVLQEKVPAAALLALKHRVKESAAFTLTATAAHGSTKAITNIRKLAL